MCWIKTPYSNNKNLKLENFMDEYDILMINNLLLKIFIFIDIIDSK